MVLVLVVLHEKKDRKGPHVSLVLPDQRREWSLMIFCAFATRSLRKMRGSGQTVLLARRAPTIIRWSLDPHSEERSAYFLWESWEIRGPSLDARSGDQLAPIPVERTSELGRIK
jgi:hypothetical protein